MKPPKPIDYSLVDVIRLLQNTGNNKIYGEKKVKATFVDTFLFSGRFNSVLGLDGFGLFKDGLKEVIKKVNADDFGANYINLDKMFEVLLNSGVYYVEEHLPEELQFLKNDKRWLTAYRYIVKNFPDLPYREFREIVKRLKDSGGHSFYIEPTDPKPLQEVLSHGELFIEQADAKAALLQLSQKELRVICEKVGISAARSIEDTANRIVDSLGNKAFEHLPDDAKSRKTLFIKDLELANGDDLIHLDDYLRVIAKVVREDLTAFIDRQRHTTLAS